MFRALIAIVIVFLEMPQFANADDGVLSVLNFNGEFTILQKDMPSGRYPLGRDGFKGQCKYGVPFYNTNKDVLGSGQEFSNSRQSSLMHVQTREYLSSMVKIFNDNCVVQVYTKAAVDAKIDVLNQTIAAQMKTIEDLINKNYKSIANDRQFKEIIERKVTEALKAKGL